MIDQYPIQILNGATRFQFMNRRRTTCILFPNTFDFCEHLYTVISRTVNMPRCAVLILWHRFHQLPLKSATLTGVDPGSRRWFLGGADPKYRVSEKPCEIKWNLVLLVPLSVQFVSFPYSFRKKYCNIKDCHPTVGLVQPPLGKTGSATVTYQTHAISIGPTTPSGMTV